MQAVSIRDAHGHVIGAAESFAEMPGGPPPRRPGCDLVAGHGLDAVTELPDSAYTESHLAGRLKFAAEHSLPFGVLCIQLNQLDSLRATHGLDAADAILNVVAHTLRNGLDSQDFLGRWGDDHFLAIVADHEDGALLTTAKRLRRLAQFCEVTWWGDQLSVTVSLGGTVLDPAETVESLLERTGNALKQARATGGNSTLVLSAPFQVLGR
jgi:diguanylate cyclase (GGDEF)-like protein